jgi:hypothetical protein
MVSNRINLTYDSRYVSREVASSYLNTIKTDFAAAGILLNLELGRDVRNYQGSSLAVSTLHLTACGFGGVTCRQHNGQNLGAYSRGTFFYGSGQFSDTPTHEMGHALGLEHEHGGIMNTGEGMPQREPHRVTPENVEQIRRCYIDGKC